MGEGERLVAALSQEPGLAGVADSRTAVLVWGLDGERLLWSSRNAAPLVATIWGRTEPGGPSSLSRRLRELGDGLAPRAGVRLERLMVGPRGLSPPATCMCRLVRFSGEEALLTAFLGAVRPVGRPAPAAQAEAKEDACDPGSTHPGQPADKPPSRPVGRRFLWRTDADHVFTEVSPALAELVGRTGAAILGLRWHDLVGHLVLDDDDTVRRDLERCRSWQSRPVLWRDVERDVVVSVKISGAPFRGPGGEPGGHRGFGIVFAADARPVPPGRFRDRPKPTPRAIVAATASSGASHEVSGSGPVRDSTGLDDAVRAAADLTGRAGETVFGVLRAWFAPQLISPAPTPSPGQARREVVAADPSPAAADPPLSSSDRGALHEIARALSGAVEAFPPQDTDPSAPKVVPFPVGRAREAELGRILDLLPIGAAVLRERHPIFANRALLELSGYEDLPTLVARGGLPALLGSALDGSEAAMPARISATTRSGDMVPFTMRAEQITWGDLPASLLLLVAEPDAEPEQRAKALELDLAGRDRRVRGLSATVELAADGVVTLDGAGRILWMSRSAERLFGFAANEVTGEAVTALVLPEDHRATLASLTAVGERRAPEAVEECEVRGRPRDGRSPVLSLRVGWIGDAEDATYSVAFRDVSRIKAMEEELRDARGVAERASANRADYLARISHEIRTPLTAITGFSELMLEERFGSIGNERYKGYVQDIHRSSGHVVSLINDLLDLAKATSGQSELSPVDLDLNALVQDCVGLATPIAARERAIVRTSFAGGLSRAFADERSVRQIVLNVLSNAIRFTGAGGQVIVSTAPAGPADVIVRVRDTGPGMSGEEIEEALTPFRQVTSIRRHDGTGLGLPLSKALVEANRGTFSVSSSPQDGTLIEIRLPVASSLPDAMAAE